MNNKAIFTKGPVRKQLFTMTLSMLIGMLGMSLFNLTDTFFIGKIGSRELAAMNFTMPVVFMVASIALGLGVGASSVISRAIGEGNKEKVQRLTSDALLLSLLIIFFITIFGYMNINFFFTINKESLIIFFSGEVDAFILSPKVIYADIVDTLAIDFHPFANFPEHAICIRVKIT
jgi:Na+-driven multidrug efflux pump